MERYRDQFAKLAFNQNPDALMVACCDSRVVPNVFASSDPGDLFVLRNIGNLIPAYQDKHLEDTSVAATIEFSLVNLAISDIIICGHSECGAMQALLANQALYNSSSTSSLNTWLKKAMPSYTRFQDTVLNNEDNLTACNLLSRINVLQQIDNLKKYPLIAEKLKNNNLRIHGWWFNLATADVYYYNYEIEKFILINEEEAHNILASLV
jgi:carbonic anhydrase